MNFEEPVKTVDQDKLQVMDELDEDWVQTWRREIRKTKMKNEDRSSLKDILAPTKHIVKTRRRTKRKKIQKAGAI